MRDSAGGPNEREPRTLWTLFDRFIPESSRLAILRDADLRDDRPSILRDQGGSLQEAYDWLREYRWQLAPLALRYVDPPDDIIAGLVADGDIIVSSELASWRSIVLSGLPDPEADDFPRPRFPLSHLAASAAFLLQTYIDLAAAHEACGVHVPPPHVDLQTGSIQFTVGGGMFASGIGLIVACAAGLVGAPIAAGAGGVALATTGLVEVALGWRKSVSEGRKTQAETLKIDAERRAVELDVKLKEIELERARLKLEVEGLGESSRTIVSLPPRLPESSEVPRSRVQTEAEARGMTEAYANHLLNRGLPNVRAMTQRMSGVKLEEDMAPDW